MTNLNTNFCTVQTLRDFGYSRYEAYEIMNLMKTDYIKEGYFLSSSSNKIPMAYAELWALRRLATQLRKS